MKIPRASPETNNNKKSKEYILLNRTFQDHVLLEDPFVQPLLMHHPPESELHGHRLMFRLAEMPENEQLIAASLRLRYEPTTTRNSTTESDRFRAHCGHQKIDPHYWPITLWLHYDLNDQSIPWDLETVGSFEPDEPSCEWSLGMNNYTMLHLPPGWFHIPLSSTILNMLQQVNMHSNPTKYVTVRLRSLVPRIDRGQTLDKLRLHPRSANGFDMSQWLHEAPHLFTFHRDPQVLLKSSKRTRRSVPEQPTRSPELGRTTTKPKINSKSFHNKPVKEAIMDLRTRTLNETPISRSSSHYFPAAPASDETSASRLSWQPSQLATTPNEVSSSYSSRKPPLPAPVLDEALTQTGSLAQRLRPRFHVQVNPMQLCLDYRTRLLFHVLVEG
ncbi:unnamed protein product [Echinostoma caproni]|uniref:Autophagy protein 5 n=1 Tax=Echinostoma caproni TaxID=27848 RepID=A0A183A6Q7_9TREM|nr:unnamed protein product [Echinostoma caproni]